MKKNGMTRQHRHNNTLQKFFMIMKLTYMFLIVTGIQTHAIGNTQTLINVNIEEMSVKEALKQTEERIDYQFFCNNDLENLDQIKNANLSDLTSDETLNEIINRTDLEYKLYEKNMVMVSVRESYIQQAVTVSGVVSDENNESMPGVNVTVKGTSAGIVTDIDGKYTITVPDRNAVLIFSFIGYVTKEILVGDQKVINIRMDEDFQEMDELVVTGYGYQKKRLVTGATLQISGDDLQKMNTPNIFTALQSQTPGLNILQSSGQPGEGFKVTIRGQGTIGNSEPLYVIDGVVGGNLNHLNPSDIESIDVLKDAASSAIYGSRGANGVILITTKQGKSGKVQISYDGYLGQQFCYKMPNLLNAKEYMLIQDEVRVNEGNPVYDWANILPDYIYNRVMDGSWEGTNWFNESYNKGAPINNHAINITGGNDISKFSLGFSYSNQEGILGKPVQSNFTRYTVRINSDHVILKGKEFDIIKIGEGLNYNVREKSGIAIGGQYSNSVTDLLVANPLLPVYDSEGNYYDYYDKSEEGWLMDGTAFNPIAHTALSSKGLNLSKNQSMMLSAYIIIQPIKNLVFKSQFGYNPGSSSNRNQNRKYYLAQYTLADAESINQSQSIGYGWTLNNTLSYNINLDKHAFDIMVGQEVDTWGFGESVSAGGTNNIFEDEWKYAWVDNTRPMELNQRSAGGSPWGRGSIASFMGRINYNYNETYMASLILRADGSSNFAPGHRWGYFPSISAGWVLTNEDFLLQSDWLNFMKLRVSWGRNGNSDIAGFQYLSTFAFDSSNSYYFGSNKTTPSTGAYADILRNPDVTWETTQQTDIGFDARFLNSRLRISYDWYHKKTIDWLIRAPILAVYGLGAPYVNGGDVVNKGHELAFDWNDYHGDFNYGVNFNLTFNNNEVTRIANSEGIIHGPAGVLSNATAEMFRAQVGYPIGYFYGYKTAGVFQTQEQVNNTAAKYPTAQPGDLIFVDTNGDGKIDTDDRTMIGSPKPDFTMGFSFNVGYKGFYLSISTYGAFGHQIAKSYRAFGDRIGHNYTTDIFGRWTGPGSSDKLPRLTAGSNINWQNISDIYIENADYLRIQNSMIGYDFKKLFPKIPLEQTRLYIAAQNLFTFSGYSGMDPDVGASGNPSYPWATGIDMGFYPSPRTFMVGMNLKF